ncbi:MULTISPECIES: hypothetical protein [Bacillaceae]|nr:MULTISPECIES: hypothetical protein [Bacillaceae]MCE4049341.1 hypothetical protein [Bacillus sp. Au-Bac7]MCM3032362.1 hypothetical protein [Niallia sp. MER 6]
MLSLILLCFIILCGTYACIKTAGESTDITPIETFDDYFIDSQPKSRKR